MPRSLHDIARDLLGIWFEPIRDLFWRFFSITERTAPLWLLTYVLLALVTWWSNERTAENAGAKGFFRYLFPPEIYGHASARADAVFFFADKVIFFVALETLAVSSDAVRDRLLSWAPVAAAPPSRVTSALLTLAIFVAFDFGAFAWHYLSHRLPVLWAFHRVHHAVEVLTPLSNYREHPVDVLGRALFQGLLVGGANAGILHLFPSARAITFFGINAFYLPFMLFFNARHSHVWISFGPFWSRLLSSPAQHQTHHGTAPEHIDVNYALILSLWDWMAGTLYVPARKEQVQYGLVGERRPFPTLVSTYVRPFVDAWRSVSGRAPGKAGTLGAAAADPAVEHSIAAESIAGTSSAGDSFASPSLAGSAPL